MQVFNRNRVVYYPITDLAAGMFTDRIREVLSTPYNIEDQDINDAIELWQCSLTVENIPQLFNENEIDELFVAAKKARSDAYVITNGLVTQLHITGLFECIEQQYAGLIWELMTCSNAYKKIDPNDLATVLNEYPNLLYSVLENQQLVKAFDTSLKDVLKSNPQTSAELIITTYGADNYSPNRWLPTSLLNIDKDQMMLDYLTGEKPNLNYVRILSAWPSKAKNYYAPSPDVLVKAKIEAERLTKELMADGFKISFGINIVFGPNKACKRFSVNGNEFKFEYSAEWLETFTDPGTILNNFIYIFDFMDESGLLTMPVHKHEDGSLFNLLLRPANTYAASPVSNSKIDRFYSIVDIYNFFLDQHGTSLEDALRWAYNEYIMGEFDIDGFGISFPAHEDTYLEKCKSIGPEIERILKTFWLYADRKTIDNNYLASITISDFSKIPSLVENKYAIAGTNYEQYSGHLFSDQSPMAYSETHKDCEPEFYSMMLKERVIRDDFPEVYQSLIDWLLEHGLIHEELDGVLKPTLRAGVLSLVWQNGAIPYYLCDDDVRTEVDELIQLDCLQYSNTLFTPDEADFVSYVFNSKFSDSLALRNKYLHGQVDIKDPNGNEVRRDYCIFLVVLIALTLKINDELFFTLSKGGVGEFIDWPLVDGG